MAITPRPLAGNWPQIMHRPIRFIGVLIGDGMSQKGVPGQAESFRPAMVFSRGLKCLMLLGVAASTHLAAAAPNLAGALALNQLPRIKPDYAGVTIPPNVAPLNFEIGRASCRERV